MALFRIPNVLRYEIGHWLEHLSDRATGASQREPPRAHFLLIGGIAALSVVLLVWTLWPASGVSHRQNKTAWFYDINTGTLFQGSAKQAGPIAVSSGPTAQGEPAGLRAHVYSYVLDPNKTELFVGFLERPDPEAKPKYAAAGVADFDKWIQGHLIRRLQDKQWVRALSPEGQTILAEQARPNQRGQTPIYQPADRKRSTRG